jgi:glycosyltransferase involved in cell wall biosynthesis
VRVRLYAHIGRRSGYGRAGAELAMSLLAAGIDLEICPIDTVTPEEARTAFAPHHAPLAHLVSRSETATSAADAVIVHTLPSDCAKVVELAKIHSECLIAYTTWEAISPIPEDMVVSLTSTFHQIWVPSRVTARAFMPAQERVILDGYLRVVPHAFSDATLEARRARPVELPEDRPYRFYYIGGWNGRKNPSGVIRAFAKAFEPSDDVELVLHCPSVPKDTLIAALASTGLGIDEMATIAWSQRPRTDEEVLALHTQGDCFVSASRGEAWNLPAFDAMLAGRHVICPGGQGSDEFLRETSADLYGGMVTPAFADVQVGSSGSADGEKGIAIKRVSAQGITSKATWMEPDLIRLAEYMKNAVDFGRRDLTVNYDPVARFGYAAVGRSVRTHLEEALSP